MSRIGRLWNSLANPDRIPKLFSLVLAVVLLIGFIIPISLDVDQIYPRPAPQQQVDEGLSLAPYDRGGVVLEVPGITKAQYPENSKTLGMITSYVSPQGLLVQSLSPYFGTSIYSSPGGLIDEILYYTRGFDTILESTILMMSFVIASWLVVNFTMNTRRTKDEDNFDSKNINNGNISNISKNDSSNINKEDQ
jgi:energy-converting hydrogenase A subunit F